MTHEVTVNGGERMADQTLSNEHKNVARLLALDVPMLDIAAQSGYTIVEIANLRGKPEFAAFLQKCRSGEEQEEAAESVELLQQEAGTSLEVLITLRDHAESETVRLNAAKELLSRAGVGSESLDAAIVLDEAVVDMLKRAGREGLIVFEDEDDGSTDTADAEAV